MKIVIVGDGKIGSTLAEQLSREGHEITIIDRSRRARTWIFCASRETARHMPRRWKQAWILPTFSSR